MTDMNKKTAKSNTKHLGGRQVSLILCFALSVLCLPSAARAQKFEIIALPDMENYIDRGFEHIMQAQTQWIVDERATENIVFASQLGDLLHYNPLVDGEYVEVTRADNMFKILDNDGQVPYSVSQGNHDGGEAYTAAFGEARYRDYSWYGDGDNTTDDSYATYNHYQIFSAGDYEFLHINLQKGPSETVLAWAQGVVDANLGKPTIISTHSYLTNDTDDNIPARGGSGDDIWDGLVKDNPQIFMTLSAHIHETPASAHLVSKNAAGEDVLQILADFEDYRGAESGETDSGYLSRIIFDPDAGTITVKTFSPTEPEEFTYLTDSDHQYSFEAEFLTQDGVAMPIRVVPEPATMSLLAIGGLAMIRRRRRA